MDTATENVATVRLRRAGTTPPGEILGTLAFSGENSAGEVKTFATLTAALGSGAVGVEDGSATLSVMSDGGTVPVLTMSGGLPDNPLSVRVGGSLKQVTQGAADSGGTGFRVLRVPN